MRPALDELNRRWEAEGKPPPDMRIGINTGDMVVGNMGGTGKVAYTVTGDGTYADVRRDVITRELDTLAVQGRSEPVRTYELLALRHEAIESSIEEFLKRYDEGIFRYRCRGWDAAIRMFRSALQVRPQDYPSRM